MLLASCTTRAVVCDDTPEPPVDWLLLSLQVGAVLLALLALLLWLRWCCRRREPRPRRRVHVSSRGDVVRGP